MICDKCNGTGFITVENNEGKPLMILKELCPKCKGNKEIDWLEDILGSNYDPLYHIHKMLEELSNVQPMTKESGIMFTNMHKKLKEEQYIKKNKDEYIK